jgi:long-subunit fatty acid transport protein
MRYLLLENHVIEATMGTSFSTSIFAVSRWLIRPDCCILHGKRARCLFFVWVVQIFFASDITFGQAERPRPPEFIFSQFRLIPIQPAGRPASMGGAFLGLADDATAAAINPAGLSFLSTPEISLNHGLGWQTYDFPVSGSVSGNGEQRYYDLVFDQTLVNIIYPQWGFTFAVFRQMAFRSEFSFGRQQFVTLNADRPLLLAEQLGASGNFPALASEHYSEVIHNSFVMAKTVAPRVHAGFTLRTTQFRLRLDERQYFEPDLWLQTDFNANPDQIVKTTRVEALYRIDHVQHSQYKPSFNLGLMLEIAPSLTLGAVYDYLPAYEVENRVVWPAYTLPDRTPNDGLDDAIVFEPEEKHALFTINLPDYLGLGLSWKANPRLLLAADVLFYRSSSLLQGVNFDLPQDDRPEASGYVDPDGQADVAVKDHVSLHAGLEYRLAEFGKIWLIRAGFYNEPNFGLQAAAPDADLQREFPDESSFAHVTAGAGVVFSNRARFEASVDASPARGQIGFIGSAVLRF